MLLLSIVSAKPTVKLKDRKGYYLLEQDVDELYETGDFYQLILQASAWVEDAITDIFERERMKPLGIAKSRQLKLDEASFGKKFDLLKQRGLLRSNEVKWIISFRGDRDNVFHFLNGLLKIRDEHTKDKIATNSFQSGPQSLCFP